MLAEPTAKAKAKARETEESFCRKKPILQLSDSGGLRRRSVAQVFTPYQLVLTPAFLRVPARPMKLLGFRFLGSDYCY